MGRAFKWITGLFRFAVLTIITVLFFSTAVNAADPAGSIRLRVKIDFINAEGQSAEIRQMVEPSGEYWEWKDGYYYYKKTVKAGEAIEVFDSVLIPPEWNNAMAGKSFDIRIRAETAVGKDNDSLWIEKDTKSGITLRIDEYELSADGVEIPYENNKTVVPGQTVSKIVKVTVNRKTGPTERTEDEEDDSEKPDTSEPEGTDETVTEADNDIKERNLNAAPLPAAAEQAPAILAFTGDESQMPLYALLCGLAAGLLVVLQVIGHRKKHESELCCLKRDKNDHD